MFEQKGYLYVFNGDEILRVEGLYTYGEEDGMAYEYFKGTHGEFFWDLQKCPQYVFVPDGSNNHEAARRLREKSAQWVEKQLKNLWNLEKGETEEDEEA